ncbi:MAG: hypothetical protein ACFCVH_03460, partial [Alphaproteobacteria bacterium]
HNNPFKWHQKLQGSKDTMIYGHPVVVGVGRMILNPVHVLMMICLRIIDGTAPNLQDLYRTWANSLAIR